MCICRSVLFGCRVKLHEAIKKKVEQMEFLNSTLKDKKAVLMDALQASAEPGWKQGLHSCMYCQLLVIRCASVTGPEYQWPVTYKQAKQQNKYLKELNEKIQESIPPEGAKKVSGCQQCASSPALCVMQAPYISAALSRWMATAIDQLLDVCTNNWSTQLQAVEAAQKDSQFMELTSAAAPRHAHMEFQEGYYGTLKEDCLLKTLLKKFDILFKKAKVADAKGQLKRAIDLNKTDFTNLRTQLVDEITVESLT